MTKTVQERAKEFALDAHDFDCGNCDTCGKCKEYRKYVDIVTEQKKIDIEKACKWFSDYLFEIGYPDDWKRDSENIISGERRFRKAMKKELWKRWKE